MWKLASIFCLSMHIPYSQHSKRSIKSHRRHMYGPNGREDIPHREWVQMFSKIMNEVKDDMKKKGREDEFVGAKV